VRERERDRDLYIMYICIYIYYILRNTYKSVPKQWPARLLNGRLVLLPITEPAPGTLKALPVCCLIGATCETRQHEMMRDSPGHLRKQTTKTNKFLLGGVLAWWVNRSHKP
jgi:hypothetical protein